MRSLFVVVCALLLVACGADKPLPAVSATITSGTSSFVVRSEVAATPEARGRGLMGRISLAPDEGMVFLFPQLVAGGFWMKGTLIPLDIAFIRAGTIVEIDSMVPCKEDPCPLTRPASAYDTALEVNAGRFAAEKIVAGASVAWTGTLPKPS